MMGLKMVVVISDGGERPAVWVFAGICKLIQCQDTTTTKEIRMEEGESVHGTEITYSELEVGTADDLQKLVNGEAVTVLYVE